MHSQMYIGIATLSTASRYFKLHLLFYLLWFFFMSRIMQSFLLWLTYNIIIVPSDVH